VSNVFVPKVNRLVEESNDNNALTGLMIRVGRIQLLILALIVVGFTFLGKPFIQLWAGAGYEESYLVALWLIIPVSLPLIQNLGIEIQRAKNMHRIRSIVYTCLAAANVVFSIFLIRWFGCVGAAVGTAIALLLGNGLFMNWYYHKKIGLNMLAFWKAMASFILPLLVVCLFGSVYVYFVHVSGWVMFLISAAVFTVVYCVAMWLLGMNAYEKQLVRKMLRKLPGVK
jgi:O-antigen/teichoic acid export membrane protein